MLEVAKLVATISGDDRPFQQAAERSSKRFDTLGRDAEKWASRMEKASTRAFSAPQSAMARFGAQIGEQNARMLQRIAQTTERHAQAAGRSLSRHIGNAAASARRHLVSLAQAILSLLLGAIQRLMSALAALGATVLRVFGAGFAAAAAGVAALTVALGALGKRGLDVNATFESASIQLGVLLKSTVAAAGAMAGLRQDAKTSTFEFTDLLGVMRKLVAVRFSVPEARRMTQILGDASVGSAGVGPEGLTRLNDLVQAFSKLKARGKLSEETAEPFMTAGIDVYRVFNMKRGETLGQRNIFSEEAIPKLLAALQGQFGGMQQRMASTGPGLTSNIKDAIADLSAQVTGPFYEAMKRAKRGILDFLNSLNQTAAGKTVLNALTKGFLAVGRGVEALVAKLPKLTALLARFLDSEQFARWKVAAGAAWEWLKATTARVLAWIGRNWERIAETLKSAALGAVKVIGGGVAFIKGAFEDLFSKQSDGAAKWQVALANLGETIKRWAEVAVRAAFRVAKAFAALGALKMVVEGLFKSADAVTLLLKVGLAGLLAPVFQGIMGQLGKWEEQAVAGIRGIDTRGLAGRLGNVIPNMAQGEGPLAAGARSALDWSGKVDAAAAALGKPLAPRAAAPLAPAPVANTAAARRAAQDAAASQVRIAGGQPVGQTARRPAGAAGTAAGVPNAEALGARLGYYQALGEANPGRLREITMRGILPTMAALFQATMRRPVANAGEWYQRQTEALGIRAGMREALAGLRPKAAGGDGAALRDAPDARAGGLAAYFGRGGGSAVDAALPGEPATAPAAGGGHTLVFNVNGNPRDVAAMVQRVLEQLQQRAFPGVSY